MRTALALTATLALPSAAMACGGFFCNTNQPVTQAAERILFAPGAEAGTLQMHVQITYGGPPTEFGWLLPVPPDVQTGLSNAAIFQRLDQAFAPQFRLTIDNNCNDEFADASLGGVGGEGGGGGGGGGEGGGAGGPDVQVLSREAVGPYDQAILAADDAAELLRWLDENDYNAPDNAGALLQSYLDNGSVFVALKLLPNATTADVAPLRLEFTADQPVVPIKPTQVAAEPDMGLIVHVVGSARAIPTNYLHVAINERAINWFNFGNNYADVVSQAADEANGQAFATDFAGPIDDNHRAQLNLRVFDENTIEFLRSQEVFGEVVETLGSFDEDLLIGLSSVIEPPEGLTVREMLNTFWQHYDVEVNGAAIADLIENTINPGRERINAMFAGERYMSRLYTTLSAAEMQVDPLFAENVDLDTVSNIHTATFRDEGCFTGNGQLIFSDGSRMAVVDRTQSGVVRRQAGETVRGLETNAAALIERMMPAGQPEAIEQDRPGTSMPTNPPMPVPPRDQDPAFSDGGDGGCGGCTTSDNAPPVLPLLVVGGLIALRRRR